MKKEKLIIVEDDAITAMDMRSILEDLGYEVAYTAAYGKDAIEQARKQKPDLVLIDVNIKGDIDGIETAEIIYGELDIPIIYITALSDDKTFQRAKATRPLAYVLKPFDEKDLKIAVEMALYKYKLERKLKESEKKYRLVVENATVGIIVVQDGKIKFANSYITKVSGYSFEELFNKDSIEFIYEADREKVEELRKSDLENPDKNILHTIRLRTKKGDILWVENKRVIINWQGKSATLNFLTDITEKKLAEQELAKTQSILQSLFEASPDLIAVFDKKHNLVLSNYYSDSVKNQKKKTRKRRKTSEHLGS